MMSRTYNRTEQNRFYFYSRQASGLKHSQYLKFYNIMKQRFMLHINKFRHVQYDTELHKYAYYMHMD
jgi:hypothetical protein